MNSYGVFRGVMGLEGHIMSNFSFLLGQDDYEQFAIPCVEAEKAFSISPTMCAMATRKAFELAVKWVYAADRSIQMPYRDNLQSLIHEPTFERAIGNQKMLDSFQYIVKAGNIAVHGKTRISPKDAMFDLKLLFVFIQWIDYSYGKWYEKRVFDPKQVPCVQQALSRKEVQAKEDAAKQELAKELSAKTERIQELERQLEESRAALSVQKAPRPPMPDSEMDISEYETRQRFIDLDLRLAGWDVDSEAEVVKERKVTGMEDHEGQVGYVDYYLKGRDGKPLAIIEAKRTSYDPKKGLEQSRQYAKCLEREFGYRPLIFLSNGYATEFVDDENGPSRPVGGVFSQDDLQRIMNRRREAIDPRTVPVNEKVAGRYYQIEAIKAFCDNLWKGKRRGLLVMATGTGKTRVSAALTDVLMRARLVKNVLFLADRVELVKQAKSAYGEYYPDWSLCNLCDNKHDVDARVVFSTYQTMIGAIDTETASDGKPAFSPGHFDLIIVDEAHRSIFKKYKDIFDHFDALVVGLTATPRDEVDRNTYDFFQAEHGVPTYLYEYKTAVERDHYLVPFYNIEAKTKFTDEGITYDDLSEEDKERYEDDFGEDDGEGGVEVPDHIDADALNRFVMNAGTVDAVLQDLMEHGIKTMGGEQIGKTIIFAQNQKHARFIVERFGALYPKLARGGFIKVVVHGEDYSHAIIQDFKRKTMPVITVSVDMMDTGVDVPEVVNLVFFKKVRSRIKFWQMIGRGTRLCEGLDCVDGIDGEYVDKKRFYIFDYCGNFEFFREQKNDADEKPVTSLSERIFSRKTELVHALQSSEFTSDENLMAWRDELVNDIHGQVASLDESKVSVRLRREYVEKYRNIKTFEHLSDIDVHDLTGEVASLTHYDGEDEYALRFDALMYGLMVASVRGRTAARHKTKIRAIATRLKERMTIPQVKERETEIKLVADNPDYLDGASLEELERIRMTLRDLIRFIADSTARKMVITDLKDPVIDRSEGQEFDTAEHYEDYKQKLNRYINEHSNDEVIRKLHYNEPLSGKDFSNLENIMIHELGSREEYQKAFGDVPLGLSVRRIIKLDHQATMKAFGEFINNHSLSPAQNALMNRIIDYVEQNGYVQPEDLARPPFDRPKPLFLVFGKELMDLKVCIERLNANAMAPIA